VGIDSLEAIQAGGSTQWIRVRGTEASNPVLLLIQQGPGLPMINETRRFGHLLGLQQAFTVIYWDQRGCGHRTTGPASAWSGWWATRCRSSAWVAALVIMVVATVTARLVGLRLRARKLPLPPSPRLSPARRRAGRMIGL
jgi:pimeloyl-ACP methyl ester carboxylesterase